MNKSELLALADKCPPEAAAILRKLAALEPAAYEIENDAERNWFDYVPYSGVASLPLYNLTGIIDHE